MGYRLYQNGQMFKMLSYFDYMVFLQAVFCTKHFYAFRRIILSMFLRRKKLKITCPFCMAYRLTKMERSSKCSNISTIWCFCRQFFAQKNSFAFRRSIFNMFLQKQKSKIACSFYMGYRLTKMENLQKCFQISTIWCFCRRFLKKNNSMHSVKSFSACFCEEKVEHNLPILYGESSKCSHSSTIWCFCRRFFAQNISMHSAE